MSPEMYFFIYRRCKTFPACKSRTNQMRLQEILDLFSLWCSSNCLILSIDNCPSWNNGLVSLFTTVMALDMLIVMGCLIYTLIYSALAIIVLFWLPQKSFTRRQQRFGPGICLQLRIVVHVLSSTWHYTSCLVNSMLLEFLLNSLTVSVIRVS